MSQATIPAGLPFEELTGVRQTNSVNVSLKVKVLGRIEDSPVVCKARRVYYHSLLTNGRSGSPSLGGVSPLFKDDFFHLPPKGLAAGRQIIRPPRMSSFLGQSLTNKGIGDAGSTADFRML